MDSNNFEKIRPFHDNETNAALIRITDDPVFAKIASFAFPKNTVNDIKNLLRDINFIDDFQIKFMHKAVRRIIEVSSDGLSFDGFDKLNSQQPYFFIANHRDIVLDSAIFQVLLVEHNIITSEIAFGDNLMLSPFITDFGKVNKMFTVFRKGTKKEMLNNLKLLSAYIRYTITQKKHSVWMAHRNGRTKDGYDKTEEALIKMLNLSGNDSFKNNFSELNIVPITISYEYEPCGTLKVNELYQSSITEYNKSSNEDLNSIIIGLMQPKGRINLSAGTPINAELVNIDEAKSYKENINHLAKFIDKQIYSNYKLWKTNYIAYDMLMNTKKFNFHYSIDDENIFSSFIDTEINKLSGDKNIFKKLYLNMYANPVINCLKVETNVF